LVYFNHNATSYPKPDSVINTIKKTTDGGTGKPL